MPLQPEYHASLGHGRQLAHDAKPGDRLYVTHGLLHYSEWVVAEGKAPFTGTPTIRHPSSPDLRGADTVRQLLTRYGSVYSQPPKGLTRF